MPLTPYVYKRPLDDKSGDNDAGNDHDHSSLSSSNATTPRDTSSRIDKVSMLLLIALPPKNRVYRDLNDFLNALPPDSTRDEFVIVNRILLEQRPATPYNEFENRSDKMLQTATDRFVAYAVLSDPHENGVTSRRPYSVDVPAVAHAYTVFCVNKRTSSRETEVRYDSFTHPDATRLIVNFSGFSSRIVIPLNGLSIDVEPNVRQKVGNLTAQISTLTDARPNLLLAFVDSTRKQRSLFFQRIVEQHVVDTNTCLYLAYPSVADERKECVGYVKFLALSNVAPREDELFDRGHYRVICPDKFVDEYTDIECANGGDLAGDTEFLQGLSETRPQDVSAKHPFIVNPVREKMVDYYRAYHAEWKIDD